MNPTSRHRLIVAAACVGAVTALALALSTVQPTIAAEPAVTADPSPVATYDLPTLAPLEPAVEPGEVVATTAVDALQAFDEPGGALVHEFTRWSYYGQPLTLLAIDSAVIEDDTWLRVLLPIQPNQSTGWIREAEVTTASTDVEIHIYLEEHELDLIEADDVLLSAPVGIGVARTPTPLGLYSVTDPLDFTANPTGVYGAFALGLSGFSEVLKTFNGGLPQIAIHGTNQPELIGQDVSNGCIRMHNEDILAVSEVAGLGTPVYIHASRAAAEAE